MAPPRRRVAGTPGQLPDEPLLVLAAEPSADVAAARVLERTKARAFGLGGPALVAAGLRLVATAEGTAGGGVSDGVLGAPRAALALVRVLAAARRVRPRVALLVGSSELGAWLGPRLRALHVRVVWYGLPQIWAWRPWRRHRLARAFDEGLLYFPFERDAWQDVAARVRVLGHPALDVAQPGREGCRQQLGLAPTAQGVALLPGSRRGEVRRLLPAFLDAATRLREARGAIDARLLLAPALPREVQQEARARAAAAGVPVVVPPPADGALAVLPAFDAALVAGGTATLEAALAGVPYVLAHRTDALTHALARRLLRVRQVGLPNLLLGAPVFPELLQHQVTAAALAAAVSAQLDAPESVRQALARVRRLAAVTPSPCDAVAEVLREQLSLAAPTRAGVPEHLPVPSGEVHR